MLNRVFAGQAQGFYIDVGAMDPVEGSVTKAFYDRGWCGINIEPDLRFYEKLALDRPRDINLDLALGEAHEVRSFYCFEVQGISTFNSRFRDHFADEHAWREERRDLHTMAEICEQHVHSPVDFLKIDAEGWEGPILRGSNWEKFRPLVLVIEATEPYSHTPAWQDWEPYLTSVAGYMFVYFDGLNRFYIRQENPELAASFAYPPNVLDQFQLYETIRAEQSAREAKAEMDGLSAEVARGAAERVAFEQSTREAKAQVERLSAEVARGAAERVAFEQSTREAKAEVERLSAEVARGAAERIVLQQLVESTRQKATDLEREARENRHWAGRLSEMLAALGRNPGAS